MSDKPGQNSLGSDMWPGLSKLAEEAGEVLQVIGKIMGAHGRQTYYDGSNLRERLLEEGADLMAALVFVIERNTSGEDSQEFLTFEERVEMKLKKFILWAEQGQ